MTTTDETAAFFSESPRSKEEDKDDRGRTISKGVRSLTAQNMGTSILALLFVSALVRYLPGAQYGIYSAISITVSIAAAFATFGLQYASARYLSILGSQRSRAVAARKIILLSTISSTLVTILLVAFSPSLSLFFTKSTSWAYDFDLAALWLFSSSIALIFQGFVQGLKRYSLLARILFISRVVMVVLTIIGLVEHANVSIAIYAWIVYGAIVTLWGLQVIRGEFQSLTNREGGGQQRGEVSQGGFGFSEILRYSFPLGIAGILSLATQNSDLVVVGGYLSPISLGVYNAVITISSFLTFVLLTPLVTAILPEASSSSKNPIQLSNGLRLALRFIFLGVLPASLFVAATSPQLLLIFSGQSSYLEGSISLELIATFYSLLAIQTVIYSVLQALGRTLQVLLITVATTSTEIGGSLVLVPHFGLLGAAVGRVLAASVGMIVSIQLARGLLFKKRENQGFYWKVIFSAIVPFFTILYLSNFVSHAIWTLAPYSLASGLLFLFCIRALKVLNNEDRALLAHILPEELKKLVAYV